MEHAGRDPWAVAVDVLAAAGRVTASAPSEPVLMRTLADALVGHFADWVFVDLLPVEPGPKAARMEAARMEAARMEAARAVASRRAGTGLLSALSALSPRACPLVSDAITRNTPAVFATVDDPRLLGTLSDGRAVADALGAQSAAVGPICTDTRGPACGAVTIVRGAGQPFVRFGELHALSQIGEFAAAALRRLRG